MPSSPTFPLFHFFRLGPVDAMRDLWADGWVRIHQYTDAGRLTAAVRHHLKGLHRG